VQYRHYHIVSFEMPQEQVSRARRWLYRKNCLGVESLSPATSRTQVRAYFENKQKIDNLKQSLALAFPEVEDFRSTSIGLSYNPEASAAFRPFALTEKHWVFPLGASSDKVPADTAKIYLSPGAVFGSGHHETTQLVAQLMELLNARPASVLDVGTGTGILAILASQLGAEKIAAVEICGQARRQARDNFRYNGLRDVHVAADLKKVPGEYDLIVANLLTPTILHLRKDLLKRLAPGGSLLLSGVTVAEVEDIREAFDGLRLEKELQKGDWVGMTLTSPK